MEITVDDLKRMLPEPDLSKPTDDYYLTLARYIDKLWGSMKVFPELTDAERKRCVLDLTGYYQDVVSDAGMWRAFVRMCRKLYGRPVPFYDEPDDYVDSELNLIDVQFIIWYSLESALGFNGLVSPYDSDLMRFARQVHKLFDFLYDDAPSAEDFQMLQELDLADKEQVRDIFRASGWLFWHSYLLRPVSKHAYEREVAEEDELTVEETLTAEDRLRTTFQQPTGPLALLVDEWLRLVVDDRLPRAEKLTPVPDHKYYKAMKHAVGDVIAFCRTYDELERFLSEDLRWGSNPEGHLPQLRDFSNFVLYADRRKGLIVAHDVAQYIRHASNACYDVREAADAAHTLVMEAGKCPVDLLRYLFENDLLPDAKYPAGADGKLLHDNWDFFARMYLRNFYRAD